MESRDALAKAVYSAMFDWFTSNLNKFLGGEEVRRRRRLLCNSTGCAQDVNTAASSCSALHGYSMVCSKQTS